MPRFSRLGRVAATAALVASGAAFAVATQVAPAGATSVALDQSCGGVPTEYANVDNSETITVTVVAGDCTQAAFQPSGGAATATLNGNPMNAGQFYAVSNSDVIVITAPASGSGDGFLRFTDLNASNPGVRYTYGMPLATGSMVAPGDGTLVVTYADTVDMYAGVVLFLAPQGAECLGSNMPTELHPTDNPPDNFQYILDSTAMPSVTLGASPAVVMAGTEAMTNIGPELAPIVAGTYQACLFRYGINTQLTLLQGIEVTLGTVTPTTQGTDPVAPSFTG